MSKNNEIKDLFRIIWHDAQTYRTTYATNYPITVSLAAHDNWARNMFVYYGRQWVDFKDWKTSEPEIPEYLRVSEGL